MSNLRLVSNGDAAIAIAWDMSQDNVAVKLYVVRGNGFTTLQTADTRATVSWVHRTTNVSIQVSAIDTSGNQGEWRSLLVAPPATATVTVAPAPAPTTAPATSATPVETTTAPSEPPTSPSVTTDPASTTVSSAGAQDTAASAATDQASRQPS